MGNARGNKIGPKLPNPVGIKGGYVDAIAACAVNNFRLGDVLESARWKLRKKIMALRPSYGCVTLADAEKPHMGRAELERFPADVRKVS